MNMAGNIEKYLKAAKKASDWLVSNQREDGCIIEAEVYYKSPYALGLTGRIPEANKLIDWIKGNVLKENGDMNSHIYKNSWIFQGAHRLARFDLSLPAIRYIMTAQASCGGFCVNDDTSQIVEPIYTAWGGLSALYFGDLNNTRRAGDCFVKMAKEQPDEMKFYYNMTADGKLLTDSGFIDAKRPKQIYYNPGIAMVFLERLYLATLDEKYLSAAKQIFEFTLRCDADAYQTPPSGKSGLGAALLFYITGDTRARNKAIEFAEYLLRVQYPEGPWGFTPNDPIEPLIDVTAEFTIFITEISATLASAGGK